MIATQADTPFLSRWSRLKRSGGEPVAVVPDTPAAPRAPLPDVSSMQFGDDFSQFLCAEVEESVKRLAMKKLFHSPIFNVMDGLDVYIDDYSIPDPLDPGMLEKLSHAHEMLFGDVKAAAQEVAEEVTQTEAPVVSASTFTDATPTTPEPVAS
jgi:hypothetical protein